MGRAACIENLESRYLCSIAMAGHQLNVNGSGSAPNTITLGLNPDGVSIYAEISYPTRKSTYNLLKMFPPSRGIRRININGGNGSDLIKIDQTNGPFPTILTVIKTRNGNDTVLGGDEPDRVALGNGIDQVSSGDGNDTLVAGRGPDVLIAGNGNDHLWAASTHDYLVAGNGTDTFTDPWGNITIQAGSGHDTYIVKNIQLDVTDYDPTKDVIKQYVPPKSPSTLLNDILNGLIDYGSFL